MITHIAHAIVVWSMMILAGFSWTVIHEFTHLVAAYLTCGVNRWKMGVFPGMLDGEHVNGWAKYWPVRMESDRDKVIILLAPFISSTLACIALPILIESRSLFSFLAFAGWMDHLAGSFGGYNTNADLSKASLILNFPLRIMRMIFLSVVIPSGVLSSYLIATMAIKHIKGL